jgi:hypothetical protein
VDLGLGAMMGEQASSSKRRLVSRKNNSKKAKKSKLWLLAILSVALAWISLTLAYDLDNPDLHPFVLAAIIICTIFAFSAVIIIILYLVQFEHSIKTLEIIGTIVILTVSTFILIRGVPETVDIYRERISAHDFKVERSQEIDPVRPRIEEQLDNIRQLRSGLDELSEGSDEYTAIIGEINNSISIIAQYLPDLDLASIQKKQQVESVIFRVESYIYFYPPITL